MKRFYNNVLSRTSVIPDASTRGLLARIMAATTYAVGGVVFLGTIGIDTAPLLAAVGVSGATLGFAAKDIGANSVAAMTLAAKRPFEHGTKLSVGNLYKGTIDHWDLQYLYLRGEKNELILIPNSVAFTSVLTIHNPSNHVFDWDAEGNRVDRSASASDAEGKPTGTGWRSDGTTTTSASSSDQIDKRSPLGKLGVTMFIVLILFMCVESVALSLSWATEKSTERKRTEEEKASYSFQAKEVAKQWIQSQESVIKGAVSWFR